MSIPLVTVICTCYNHQDFVKESLDAVKNQTYSNIELIIVDDYSNDDSVDVIDNWLTNNNCKTFVKNPENYGITKSFNKAVKRASGSYLLDLAADDVLNTNCIEQLVNLYRTSTTENIGIVYGNAEMIDEFGNLKSIIYEKENVIKIKKALTNNFYQHLLMDSSYICSVSALYKKSVFDGLNGYDENLYFEDLDYWLRATKEYNILFTEKVVVKKRHLENSLGNSFFVKNKHTKSIYISFYKILRKAYNVNENKLEHIALKKRILKQSRWAIRTLNFKYIFLYLLLFIKTTLKINKLY